MQCRAQSVLSGRDARRARPRLLSALAVFAAGVLTLIVVTPAMATVADTYEPDDSYLAAKSITVDAAPQQRSIFPYGDEDWVSFTVVAGTTYAIRTTSGTPAEYMDTVLRLYDSNGTTQLAWNDDYSSDVPYSQIVYQANANKTVYARVEEYSGGSTGTYALSVRVAGDAYEPDGSYAAAKPVTVGAPVQPHTIAPGGDEDWVSFPVAAGKTYAVEVLEDAWLDLLNVGLRLYDSDGTTQLSYGDGLYYDEYYWDTGNAHIDYKADQSETVYAQVVGQQFDAIGSYTLGVTEVSDAFEGDDSFGAAKPIMVGAAAQQRSIFPAYSDEDWVSLAVTSGWKYTVQTGPGTPLEDLDHVLALYDADGTTELAVSDAYGDHEPELIVYTADADKTVYLRITPSHEYSTGTYALTVTAVPIARLEVVGSVDFGEVAVGQDERRTLLVSNTGAAPLMVSQLQLAGAAGFSIVRDEVGGDPIPAGASREIELAYAPVVACTGAPVAVKHLWTDDWAEYRYSGATLIGFWLYSGFQNTGGAGNVDWRVSVEGLQTNGTGAVVAGGRYTVRVAMSAGMPWESGFVELLLPVSDGWELKDRLGSLQGVAYLRVPDATLSIASNDDDEPTIDVDLFGVAVPSGPDSTPPTTSDDVDDQWHRSAVTVHLTPVDSGGSGMSGGLAKTEYSKDGGATWATGTSVTYGVWKRGGGSGLHTLLYRSTDAAGNLEETRSCAVMIDARPPVTTNDAPLAPQAGPVTVHLTATDSLFGVSACSGVASLTYRLDGGAPQTVPGASVSVPVSGAGLHWIAYAATDAAGNAEYVKWCTVTILAGAPAKGSARGTVHRASLLR